MANVKAIIVDLDRTLLHTDKSLSSYTVGVLKECKARGIKVMVATARPQRAIEEFCAAIDFDATVVSNGARIICGGKRTEHGISQSSAEALLTALSKKPLLPVTLETGDCAYSNVPIPDYETVVCDDLTAVALTEGTLKILVHMNGEDTLSSVRAMLTEDLYHTVANGYLMQIMSKEATKWNGIKVMLEIAGCIAEEAAYFGDDWDDLEPIKQCGLGVAVSNGITEVKAVADRITESNDEDGVAKFIARSILKTV